MKNKLKIRNYLIQKTQLNNKNNNQNNNKKLYKTSYTSQLKIKIIIKTCFN